MVDVYCDIEFLKKFYSYKSDLRFGPSNEKDKIWLSLSNFFNNGNNIIINISIDRYDNYEYYEQHPFIKHYVDLWNSSTIELNFNDAVFNEFDSDEFYKSKNQHKLFFIESDSITNEERSSRFGFYFLNTQTYEEVWNKIALKSKFLKISQDGDIQNWIQFEEFRHPFRSILINDRYIFKLQKDNYLSNVKGLLSSILPQSPISYTIDLTFICQDINKDLPLEKVESEISSLLTSYFSHITFDFTLIQIQGDNRLTHGRRIFTNYYFLSSDSSIQFSNKSGDIDADSDLFIFSIFDCNEFKAAQNRIVDFKNLICNSNGEICHKFCGSSNVTFFHN